MVQIHFYQRAAGVDVAKATLEACLLINGQEIRCGLPNTPEGFAQLIELCRKYDVQIVVLEATGGLQRPLALALVQAGIAVAVINPARIRHFALGEGFLAKTDKVDARIIATFALKIAPAATAIRSEQQETLARLGARKQQLIRARVQEQNRLQQEAQQQVLASIRRHLEFLQQEIQTMDQQLDELVERDEQLELKAQTADALAGVGRASAVALVVSMPELGTLSSKQAAALAGLAPFNRDSGLQEGERHIYGGRAAVRQTLYMCVLTAIRQAGKLQSFYQSLLAKGKCKMKALTACMRKMLVILNARIRDALLARNTCSTGQGAAAIAAGG